ncbi:ATP-dependent RNA helicase DHX34 [Paragonimus westermani]|uniref:ATP-dependent RNA helicase DHX34 n=1 Tax=Paragonimus westermani TaxID=34504 RepID=A0A5J4NV44_9TREM|nr:ATP-dependent RNA helicase DHX34 [Paragonimus westermani]
MTLLKCGVVADASFCLHLLCRALANCSAFVQLAKIMKLRRDQAALPMAAYRSELLRQLSVNQVVVVAGDTGCGKSTQVPQYLHHGIPKSDGTFDGGYRCIAVTQPRRIACISLATRVSTEMLCERSSKVAYQVRFERSRTKATQILFLTEGLLLRQMQLDPFLKEYDVIVLDEANFGNLKVDLMVVLTYITWSQYESFPPPTPVHERHWQTDCLLGLVKCLVSARPELRVVLMSATINVKLFSSFFNDCPIIEVPGRLYPIELKYIPLTPSEITGAGDRIDPAPYLRLLQRIDARYPATERGDMLVFLPGMADIQAIMEPAKAYAEQTKRWIILPLHSTLSARDQEKVFHVAPDGVRKCVLSTNIAETSLTIDGIRFVADSGRVKELSWDASAHMRRLKEFPISKASADQRKGRAGRTGPGLCFRLFSQEDYESFEVIFLSHISSVFGLPQPFSTPEIRRVPLETLVLQMIVMGLPDVTRFPFIEAPESKTLEESLELLKSHGALVEQEQSPTQGSSNSKAQPSKYLQVTPLGRLLADLPVDFSLGRMLIMASLLGLVEPVLSLVAGMSVQSPLLPSTVFSGAEQARRIENLSDYESNHGDAFTVLNVFDEWLKIKSDATSRSTHEFRFRDTDQDGDTGVVNARRWCRRIGAQEQRLHEMVRLRTQFAQLLRDCGLWTSRGARRVEVRQRQDLNHARRAERVQTKRRRLLTLQDGVDVRSGSDDEEETQSDTQVSNLRRWLASAGSGGGKTNRARAAGGLDVSVRDLELVLCYDLSALAEYASRHGRMTQADIVLLKVVLAGGLYPHLAIGDVANTYRVANRGGAAGPGAEMVFHTRAKGFVSLHPNDVFVRNPDVLFSDSTRKPDINKKAKMEDDLPILPSGYAWDHQLLMYLDIMETTKPFLVNTLRVPVLPTLLLYAREVDTNANASRIVFDAWLEVRLADVEAAQRALATSVWLRATMEQLMNLRLTGQRTS